jgi:hypothetical protein
MKNNDKLKLVIEKFLDVSYPVQRIRFKDYNNKRNLFRRVIVTDSKTHLLNNEKNKIELKSEFTYLIEKILYLNNDMTENVISKYIDNL